MLYIRKFYFKLYIKNIAYEKLKVSLVILNLSGWFVGISLIVVVGYYR